MSQPDLVSILNRAAPALPQHLAAGEISIEKPLIFGRLMDFYKVPYRGTVFGSQIFHNTKRGGDGGGVILFWHTDELSSIATFTHLLFLITEHRGKDTRPFAPLLIPGWESLGVAKVPHHDLVARLNGRITILVWMTDVTDKQVVDYEVAINNLLREAHVGDLVDALPLPKS